MPTLTKLTLWWEKQKICQINKYADWYGEDKAEKT